MKFTKLLCMVVLLSTVVFNIDVELQGSASQQVDTESAETFAALSAEDRQQLLQNAQVTEQRIQIKPKVITQRITAKPKIITERIIGQPRVVTEQVIEPTRQRIVIEPKINQTVEQIKPEYNREEDQVIIRDPVTKEVQYKNEQRRQQINIEGDIVNNNFVVQPQLKRIKAEVQFQPRETVEKTLSPMVREPIVQNKVTPKTFPVEADVFITQPFVQPIQQKEYIKVDWQQGEDRVVERNPVTREPIYQTRQRVQNVSVPGNTYYTQKVVQPQVNREELEVRFQQAPTIERNLEPIVRDTQYSRSKSVQRTMIPYTVTDEVPVGVPRPVVYDVPVYQYKYEPVEEPCEPCCCDGNTNGKLGNVDSIVNSADIEIVQGDDMLGVLEVGETNEQKRVDRNNNDRVYFGDAVEHYQKQYGSDTLQRKDRKKRRLDDDNRMSSGISSQNNLHLTGTHSWNQVSKTMNYNDFMGY